MLEAEPYGEDPVLGSILAILTAVCYAGYLLLLRKGRDRQRAAGPIFDSTLTCGLTALAAGLVLGDFDPVPSLPMHAWLLLLALSAQVAGQVMIATALPRLPAATTSLILLLQPVLATIIAMIVLSESPSSTQLLGVSLVIGGVILGSARGRSRSSVTPAPV